MAENEGAAIVIAMLAQRLLLYCAAIAIVAGLVGGGIVYLVMR